MFNGGLVAARCASRDDFLFARDPGSTPDGAHLRDADYSSKWIPATATFRATIR